MQFHLEDILGRPVDLVTEKALRPELRHYVMPTPKRKPATSSRFSDFIRNAPAREKKKVYEQVLKRSSERQRRVLEKSKSDR